MSLALLLPQGGSPPPPPTVSTGDARFPGTDVYPDPNLYPSQGPYPIPRLLLSTDLVSNQQPSYADVTTDLREYSTSHGRGSELEEFDAGTCSVVLNDRARAYDPNVNASIRPFNRIWLLVEHAGEVRSRFKGYVQSWVENYDRSGIVDATATADAADEFVVLASVGLPTTDPPRDSYQALAQVDNPVGYWDFNESSDSILFEELARPSPVEQSDVDSGEGQTAEKRVDRRAFPSKGHRKRG